MRYFVVCEMDSTNALRAELRHDEDLRPHRAFSEQLFREGKLLWERPVGRIHYLHPSLRVYEMP